MELRRKGIDDEVAREALDEIDPDDEVEVARALVRAKLRTVRNLDRDKAIRRLVGMLGRKGHSAGVAFRVVKEELDLDSLDAEVDLDDEIFLPKVKVTPNIKSHAFNSDLRFDHAKDNARWWAMGATAMSLFVVGLDMTVLNVALPDIAVDLNASTAQLQWFATPTCW